MLLTWHNVRYYQDLMTGIRQAITEQRLDAFSAEFYAARTTQEDEANGKQEEDA